jgi:hypothetical protein
LRQQFSLPENVQMSLLTASFLRDLADHLQILGKVLQLLLAFITL